MACEENWTLGSGLPARFNFIWCLRGIFATGFQRKIRQSVSDLAKDHALLQQFRAHRWTNEVVCPGKSDSTFPDRALCSAPPPRPQCMNFPPPMAPLPATPLPPTSPPALD